MGITDKNTLINVIPLPTDGIDIETVQLVLGGWGNLDHGTRLGRIYC